MILAAVIVLVGSFAVGGAVAADGPVVKSGTTFNASADGPTITITEDLELNDSAIFPDNRTVDLSPNATFRSDGATNATVESIDGEWTNLTTRDVAAGLEVDPLDKQAVTITGENVSSVSIRDVDTDSAAVDLGYSADAELTLTLTDLPANTDLEAVDTATDETLGTNTTDSTGTAAFTLTAADNRTVTLREPATGGSGSVGGGGGGGDPTPTTVQTRQTNTGTEASIQRVTLEEPTVTFDTPGTASGDISVRQVSAIFEKATNTENTMTATARSSPPSGIPAPSNAESVLGYVDITIEGSLAESVSEGRFTVDVSGTGVDPADVTAQRYDGSQWQDVETNPVDETAVEVISPDGYSVFAIDASESGEPEQVTATQTPIETETPVETTTPAGTATSTVSVDSSTPTPEPTATPAPTPTPGAGGPGFGVVVAVLALVATLATLRRR